MAKTPIAPRQQGQRATMERVVIDAVTRPPETRESAHPSAHRKGQAVPPPESAASAPLYLDPPSLSTSHTARIRLQFHSKPFSERRQSGTAADSPQRPEVPFQLGKMVAATAHRTVPD